jgi:hypothetical protein
MSAMTVLYLRPFSNLLLSVLHSMKEGKKMGLDVILVGGFALFFFWQTRHT